jgi:hypothetical protein
MLILSSLLTSLEDLLELRSVLSPGRGGGELLLPFFPGGVTDLRDLRELRDTLRESARYGVSAGVGSATGPVDSSSVSHTAILKTFRLLATGEQASLAELKRIQVISTLQLLYALNRTVPDPGVLVI